MDETDQLPRKLLARSPRTKLSYGIFAYKQPSAKPIAKLAGNVVDKESFSFKTNNRIFNAHCLLSEVGENKLLLIG